jgi:hypothetical protein
LLTTKVGQDVKVTLTCVVESGLTHKVKLNISTLFRGWRIEGVHKQALQQECQKYHQHKLSEPATDLKEEDHDDLPF